MNELMSFNENFKKNVTCDNIKSDNKSGLHPLSGKRNLTPQPFNC